MLDHNHHLTMINGTSTTNMHHLDRFDKAEIRNALQNWQMSVLMNELPRKDDPEIMGDNGLSYRYKSHACGKSLNNSSQINRGNADGSPNIPMHPQQFQQSSTVPTSMQSQQQSNGKNSISMTHQSQNEQKPQQQQPPQQHQQIYPSNRSPTLLEFQKKSNRRRETRRHTLQNGIDYNMLKRIRHYEEEKDLLLDGLHAVEKAQEWYFKQIALIQEKMKCLGRGDTHLVSKFIAFLLLLFIDE